MSLFNQGMTPLISLILLPLHRPVASDPATQFDFWVGDWDLEVATRSDPNKDQWETSKAKNHIEKILDGKVVCENFAGEGLVGKSWSVYDPKANLWRQTWVDNQGSYLSLTGSWKGDRMILNTLPDPAGSKRPYRMTFSKIQPDSFSWVWEVQKKNGDWAPMFTCHYKRKSG